MLKRKSLQQNSCDGRLFILLLSILSIPFYSQSTDISKTESQFLNELKNISYPEARPPDRSSLLRWDFSSKNIHEYKYDQTIKMRMQNSFFKENTEPTDSEITSTGKLIIKSQGNNTANLILEKIEMESAFGTKKKESMKLTSPPVVLQGLKNDGTLNFDNTSGELFLRMIFPLPPRELSVGESVDVPAQFPFNAMGSLLIVKGRTRITLTKYVTIQNRKCARLDSDINISQLDVPSELSGKYNCFVKGGSVFFFDIENRRFVSGKVAVLMAFDIDAPAPKIETPGNDYPPLPDRTKTSMQSDNFIEITSVSN